MFTLKLEFTNLSEIATSLIVAKEFSQSVPAGAVEFGSFVQGGTFRLKNNMKLFLGA